PSRARCRRPGNRWRSAMPVSEPTTPGCCASGAASTLPARYGRNRDGGLTGRRGDPAIITLDDMVESTHVLTAVAWPYASGPRHIGHVAGFNVPSDVFSRYQQMAGNRVLM